MTKRQRADTILDPVKFAKVWLRHNVWPQQAEILRSIANHKKTAVKACHASAKTFTAAEAVLWWITSGQERLAVTTAPTWTQVEKLLWGEIKKAVAGAQIAYPKPLTTELRLGPNRYAIGLSTNEGVRFQGFHGDILIVIDEAPGVDAEIWEAIEGIRAGGDVRILAIGNPVFAAGPFYDAFTRERELWSTHTISALSTPNFEGVADVEALLRLSPEERGQSKAPYLITREWVYDRHKAWGESHPLFQARVLGEFPSQNPYALVSLAMIEAARRREIEVAADEPLEAGVDVAGSGDDETVVYVRRGPRIVDMMATVEPDPRGAVAQFLGQYRAMLMAVKVDTIGLGYNFALHLADLGFPVTMVNVGAAATDSERFANLKAELYWGLKERFDQGAICGDLDETTIAQLTAIPWRPTPRGQTAIVSKDELKRKGIPSPDRAEALMLAFAPVYAEPEGTWMPEDGSLVSISPF